jgi:CheY-like chemotaxis protein
MAKNILVVDDDPDFLEQQKLMMESAGYDVRAASSEAEAEEILEGYQPDLAVVDLMMEKADGGFTLCYHIKKRYPDTPVIIVTAVSSETGMEFDASTDEEKSWIKADAFLAKPIRFEQLKQKINTLLERS